MKQQINVNVNYTILQAATHTCGESWKIVCSTAVTPTKWSPILSKHALCLFAYKSAGLQFG